jgi:hypothetical protein
VNAQIEAQFWHPVCDAHDLLHAPKPVQVLGQDVVLWRDLQGKVFGTLPFITDVKVDGMWHARMIRPPHAGGHVQTIDTASIAAWPQAQVVHQQDMLAVVAPGEWMAVQAARALQVQWSADGTRWPGHDGLHAALRAASAAVERNAP